MRLGRDQHSRDVAPGQHQPDAVIAVIIVSYRTPHDVATCLQTLDRLPESPCFKVFVCENGGPSAWDSLVTEVEARFGPRRPINSMTEAYRRFVRIVSFRLQVSGHEIRVGEAEENLGYAGGVNAWLLPLLKVGQWQGFWVLNPDTLAGPNTLFALIENARQRNLGIVGSRIMKDHADRQVRSMGLRWRRLRVITQAVGYGSEIETSLSPERLDAQIDAPSGASMFLTRACAKALAPLDERYFLYYEDLDWGVRAKPLGYRVGYAHDSVVVHAGGRSLGSASNGPGTSELALYLEHRNRLLFVAKHHPRWWAWTVVLSWVRVLRLARRGGFVAACGGLLAGMRGEAGRPDRLLAQHRPSDG